MILAARIALYVQGQELKPELMSPTEVDAIINFVHDLFRNYGSRVFFDADMTEDEEGQTVLLLHCFQETEDGKDSRLIPFPAEWVKKTVVFGVDTELRLIGDRLPAKIGSWERAEIKLTNFDDE